MKAYRMGLAVAALVALVAGSWYLSRPDLMTRHTAQSRAGPAPEQVAALEREAEKACLCNRASKKGCWDTYNRMTAGYATDTNTASACFPISTQFDTFKNGETVAVSYSIVGTDTNGLSVCTKREARTLEEIWSRIAELPEGASREDSNRALSRADAAVIAAARKMIAGTYTERFAEHRPGQASCVG